MSIQEDIQKLEIGRIVTLFEVDTTNIGGSEIIRFSPTTSSGAQGRVVFDGNEYIPLDCEATGFEYSGKGTIPTPTLSISNALGLISGLLIEFDDLVGASVKRIRVFEKYLDNGTDPNPNGHLPIDEFVVEQKSNQNQVYVEFVLSSVLDQEGAKLPARQILRQCTHTYRNYVDGEFTTSGISCPYIGDGYFTSSGEITTADKDLCGKKVSDCQLRFGSNAQLPTRAFPSVARVR